MKILVQKATQTELERSFAFHPNMTEREAQALAANLQPDRVQKSLSLAGTLLTVAGVLLLATLAVVGVSVVDALFSIENLIAYSPFIALGIIVALMLLGFIHEFMTNPGAFV